MVCDTLERLWTNLAQLDVLLELGTSLEPEAQRLNAVYRWLREHDRWLLILDNVDDPEVAQGVYGILPQLTRGHVLITSRISAWQPGIGSQRLDVWDTATAVNYLFEATGQSRDSESEAQAKAVAEALDGLPLALE